MIKEPAYAKINLSLDVVGKREDGYHDLEMIMASIDLYDDLTFQIIPENRIRVTCEHPQVPTDERNLVYQAIRLMKDRYHIREGLAVHIDKRIPVTAGLAGGSSDAAATIRAINRLFDLNLTFEEMLDIGLYLGSDVPYCIYGRMAYVTGRGENIEPLPSLENVWVVVIHPDIAVSTKEIFSHVKVDQLAHPSVQQVKAAILKGNYSEMVRHMGNALETITFNLYPEVRQLKDEVASYQPDAVLMSGSGPTLFALTQDPTFAEQLKEKLDIPNGVKRTVFVVKLKR